MAFRVAPREFLPLIFILATATLLRVANLGSVFIMEYDEGVYCESARMILRGYLPYNQVFSSQPPYFILAIAGFFKLLGMSVVSARLFVVVTSILGIVSVYLIAKSIEDYKAGLVAAWCLAVSPFFLELSRTVESDVPSVSFVLLGVWLFFRSLRSRSRRWVVLSGFALGLGTMMKLNVGLAAILILAVLVARKNAKGAALFIAGCMIPLLILPAFDLHKVIDQMVLFHISKPATGTFLGRRATILSVLTMDLGLAVTALFGAFLCVIRRDLESKFILVLAGGMFLFLVTFRALFIQHIVMVIPLLAVLSGIGLVTPLNVLWKQKHDHAGNRKAALESPVARVNGPRVSTRALLIVALSLWVFYAASSVPLISGDLVSIAPADNQAYRDAAATIRAYTNDNDYIISDSQALAFFAERDVPPDLVDTSHMRIDSGYLDPQTVIELAEEYRVGVVVLCTGRLIGLGTFVEYVKSNFKLVADYNGCEIYARHVSISSGTSDAMASELQCVLVNVPRSPSGHGLRGRLRVSWGLLVVD